MGIKREKKLREQARILKETLGLEADKANGGALLLQELSKHTKLLKGKVDWYESCINEYKRLLNVGLIKIFTT